MKGLGLILLSIMLLLCSCSKMQSQRRDMKFFDQSSVHLLQNGNVFFSDIQTMEFIPNSNKLVVIDPIFIKPEFDLVWDHKYMGSGLFCDQITALDQRGIRLNCSDLGTVRVDVQITGPNNYSALYSILLTVTDSPSPPGVGSNHPDLGRIIYQEYCLSCHGTEMQGKSFQEIVQAMIEFSGDMGFLSEVLTDDEIRAIAEYF